MFKLSSAVVAAVSILSVQAVEISASAEVGSGLVSTAWYASWHNKFYPLSEGMFYFVLVWLCSLTKPFISAMEQVYTHDLCVCVSYPETPFSR